MKKINVQTKGSSTVHLSTNCSVAYVKLIINQWSIQQVVKLSLISGQMIRQKEYEHGHNMILIYW